MKESLIELKNGEDDGISQEECNMSFLVCNRCASWHLAFHTSYMSESTGYEYISECFVMTHNAHTCIRMKELLSARCVRECVANAVRKSSFPLSFSLFPLAV